MDILVNAVMNSQHSVSYGNGRVTLRGRLVKKLPSAEAALLRRAKVRMIERHPGFAASVGTVATVLTAGTDIFLLFEKFPITDQPTPIPYDLEALKRFWEIIPGELGNTQWKYQAEIIGTTFTTTDPPINLFFPPL